MSSSDLQRHYHVYKHGGDQVARWLLSAAGYRDSNQTKKHAGPVPTARLLQLANSIATRHRPIQIPDEILELVEEVIDARENCANFYFSQGLDCSGHRHYLLILRQVREVLKQAKRRRSATVLSRPKVLHRASSSGISWQAHEEEVSAPEENRSEAATFPTEESTVVVSRGHRRSARV